MGFKTYISSLIELQKLLIDSITKKDNKMKLNQAGIDLVKDFEGCYLTAYPDPGSGGDPWTIGYGATGPDIHPGLVWTQIQADNRLMLDLALCADQVTKVITTKISDNAFSALVSFAYNCGIGNLKSSTLLKLVNSNALDHAADEFPKWNKASGHVMAGLTRRRLAERALFKA